MYILNTLNIVHAMASIIKANGNIPSYEVGKYEDWVQNYRDIEDDLKYAAGELFYNKDEFYKNFPLRDNNVKLIIKELYGFMPFSKENILKRYQKKYKNKMYLFYPGKKVKRLIILMTGYIDYVSYNRFSWYWDEEEKWERDTAYLFLCDVSKHWYVGMEGEQDKEIYKEIIEGKLMELNLSSKDAYIIGASMGGYASLLFGIECGLGGIISVHPQLSKKSAYRYHKSDWILKINECGINFIEVDDLIAKTDNIPPLYLEIGRNPADQCGLKGVLEVLNNKKCFLLLNRTQTCEHDTKSPDRLKIEKLISVFDYINKSSEINDATV